MCLDSIDCVHYNHNICDSSNEREKHPSHNSNLHIGDYHHGNNCCPLQLFHKNKFECSKMFFIMLSHILAIVDQI